MSNETWLEEHYQIPAKDVPEADAIKHSLAKWYGLRKSEMNKHGIEHVPIEVNGETCALCHHYIDLSRQIQYVCDECPLCQYLGKRCYAGDKSVFALYDDCGNPEPMIAALEAIAFVEETCK